MSDAWNLQVSDEQLEQLNLRAKYRLSQLQVVLTYTYQRKSVSEIARLLGVQREIVIWMQHVLRLRTEQGRRRKQRFARGLGRRPAEPSPPEAA